MHLFMVAKYLEYLRSFYHNDTPVKTRDEVLRYAFRNRQGRDSEASAAIPIWANCALNPTRVRLIRGKAELLLGMNIARELDIAVSFGSDRFKFGQGWWK